MSTCIMYDMEWWHFIVPSIFEFSKVCDSYDKTYMFLVGFSRFIFWVLIFMFLNNNKIIIFDEYEKVQYFFFIIFFTITVLSFFNLVMIAFKKQTNPQKQVEIEFERKPEPKKQVIPIQIFDDDLSATTAERAISGY